MYTQPFAFDILHFFFTPLPCTVNPVGCRFSQQRLWCILWSLHRPFLPVYSTLYLWCLPSLFSQACWILHWSQRISMDKISKNQVYLQLCIIKCLISPIFSQSNSVHIYLQSVLPSIFVGICVFLFHVSYFSSANLPVFLILCLSVYLHDRVNSMSVLIKAICPSYHRPNGLS